MRIPSFAVIICGPICSFDWEIITYGLSVKSFDFFYSGPLVSSTAASIASTSISGPFAPISITICPVIRIPGISSAMSCQLNIFSVNKAILCAVITCCRSICIYALNLELQSMLVPVVIHIENRVAFCIDLYILVKTVEVKSCVLFVIAINSGITVVVASSINSGYCIDRIAYSAVQRN